MKRFLHSYQNLQYKLQYIFIIQNNFDGTGKASLKLFQIKILARELYVVINSDLLSQA